MSTYSLASVRKSSEVDYMSVDFDTPCTRNEGEAAADCAASPTTATTAVDDVPALATEGAAKAPPRKASPSKLIQVKSQDELVVPTPQPDEESIGGFPPSPPPEGVCEAESVELLPSMHKSPSRRLLAVLGGKKVQTVYDKAKTDMRIRQTIGGVRRQNNYIPPYGAERVMWCMGPKHWLRERLLYVAEHRYFERFIITVIMLNCLSLAVYDPTEESDVGRNKLLEQIEYVFLAVFTIEAAIKILAYGFVTEPGSYLRNAWNILDFIIVVSGWASVIGEVSGSGDGADLKALRALRVLRSLRVIQGFPSLQLVINSILKSFPRLMHVAIVSFAIIILYAIMGVEFFGGELNSACFFTATNERVNDRPCRSTPGGGHMCGPEQFCRRGVTGPNNGITSFDNIGVAMLTVFQCLTLEGWTDILYDVEDAVGANLPWIYFVSLIILGSFFVLNLVLGVISAEFTNEGDRAKRQELFERSKKSELIEEDISNYLGWLDVGDDGQKLSSIRDAGLEPHDEELPGFAPILILTNTLPPKRKIEWDEYAHPKLAMIVKSTPFVMTVMFIVFVNTIFLAIDHAGQSDALTDLLRISDFVFVSIFTIELGFKLFALGLRQYFWSKFNGYDALVVALSILELLLVEAGGFSPMGMSVLRSLRLLRLLKLTPYYKSLSALVNRLLANLGSIVSLLGLLQLLIIIFALLGMQLFGGRFDPVEERSNFDDFWKAYLTVFQILTGEDWNVVMYAAIDSYGGIKSEGSLACVYFILLVTLGNYVVLNIFLAIAVASLEALIEAENEDDGEDEKQAGGDIELAGLPPVEKAQPGESRGNALAAFRGEAEPPVQDKDIPDHYSLFIFSPENRLRVFSNNLIWRTWFDNFILVCIVISSLLLAVEDPVEPDSPRNQILEKFDYFFTAIFGLEMMLKIIALGLVLHPRAYMRSPWNLLDMFVVVGALISIALASTGTDVSAIKVLRILRVLRPLRAINRAQKLKEVVQCLISSVSNIGAILVVTVMFVFLFAVMGVQLFKGSFVSCTDTAPQFFLNEANCVGFFAGVNETSGLAVPEPREWVMADFNYNNVIQGMKTLFAASTGEGWPNTLYNSIDSRGEDRDPRFDARPAVGLFYIVFMIIVAFFMVNVFVGYVIVTFRDTVEREFKECPLTKSQRSCLTYALEIKPINLHLPKNPPAWQKRLYQFVTDLRFEYTIMFFIVLNLIALMMKYEGMSDGYELALTAANWVFTGIFTVECILKLLAFGWKGYFSDSWNVFDFVIVVGSLLDIGLDGRGVNVTFLRIFRAARLIKLLKRGEIKRLIWTFFRSFKSLPWVGLLIGMLFFVYAVVGMQVFGRVELIEGRAINSQTNFRTLPAALSVLFRSATGEGWQEVMQGCILQPPDCDPHDEDGSTCGNAFAYVYFVSFVLLCSFLIINLFVAVIVDNFEYLTTDSSELAPHHVDEFRTAWALYDRDATGKMSHSDFVQLLKDLGPPFGLGQQCPTATVHSVLMRLDAPMDEHGNVLFKSVMCAMIRNRMQILPDLDRDEMRFVVSTWLKGATVAERLDGFPKVKADDHDTTIKFLYSVIKLQTEYRLYKRNKAAAIAAREKQGAAKRK